MRRARVAVKVCGLTRAEDAAVAASLGAAALGVVFAPSPRQVNPARAARVLQDVPPWIARVGVFVDPPAELVEEAVVRCRLSWIQLAGAESPERVLELAAVARRAAEAAGRGAGPRVLQTIHLRSAEALMAAAGSPADAFLLDAPPAGGRMGGSGRRFDWELAATLPWPRERVVLAGGLTPANVAAALATVGAGAVDVSSGVEAAPGIKDRERLEAFLVAVRRASLDSTRGARFVAEDLA